MGYPPPNGSGRGGGGVLGGGEEGPSGRARPFIRAGLAVKPSSNERGGVDQMERET